MVSKQLDRNTRRAIVLGTALVLAAAATQAASNVALTDVAAANTKVAGMARPNLLSPELRETIVVQGSSALENPSPSFAYYGYGTDGTMLPLLPAVQEATKTEADKNTYLVLDGQTGPDAAYDYGHHFLFQGHENGPAGVPSKRGSITRVNLDADHAHRVTLWAEADSSGTTLPTIDGSTWDPFANRLLFTSENGNTRGGVWQSTLTWPPLVEDLAGSFGRASYEGIQNASDGSLYMVEDSGGTTVNNARQPNSFVYRFIPRPPQAPAGPGSAQTDLKHGMLQALQVASLAHPGPIEFHAGQAAADILSQDVKDLHTYGLVLLTTWVTLHDTETDGTLPYDAAAFAKAAHATPFKRPENGVFRPGTGFGEYYFTETGDTNQSTGAGTTFGGFGGVFKLSQAGPSASTGTLRILYRGDSPHSGLDNIQFLTRDQLLVVEDCGDTHHGQRNALDSGYVLDVTADYGAGLVPVRFLAEGRDASATLDSFQLGPPSFNNDGDNEITGIHVSDGDPSRGGILGGRDPRPFEQGWRVFFSQQHGDNVLWEIVHADTN